MAVMIPHLSRDKDTAARGHVRNKRQPPNKVGKLPCHRPLLQYQMLRFGLLFVFFPQQMGHLAVIQVADCAKHIAKGQVLFVKTVKHRIPKRDVLPLFCANAQGVCMAIPDGIALPLPAITIQKRLTQIGVDPLHQVG